MNERNLIILPIGLAALLVVLLLSPLAAGEASAPLLELTPTAYAYFPLVARSFTCPTTSTNEYGSGIAYQVDEDDPVRPAYNHADKNIELRGYTANPNPDLERDLIDYGSDDPTQPPQLATLFDPPRVPALVGFYQAHHWDWAASPDPGQRLGPILIPPVTALGLQTTPGEILRVPASGYDIGGGMEALVLFADHDTVALRYTREDSSAPRGYTVHIDNICTDPNLLALYDALDNHNGPRYQYPIDSYNLPNLHAGQPFAVARSSETVVAIVDTGSFQDSRSLNEWWQIRPGRPRYPDDEYYTNQWALAQVNAPQAWAHSTGAGVVIAVLDTGVDLDHPDLEGKILAELGWDFVNDDGTADDDHGHGTHVAGIAAAATDNGLGVAGLGWDARILALKVLKKDPSGGPPSGSIEDVTAAIDYAVAHGAQVINLSLGAPGISCSDPGDNVFLLRQAIDEAYRAGALIAAAGGNDGQPAEFFPANCEHVLGVAATDQGDLRASYSNYGGHVSVAAPGSWIYSTLALEGGNYGYDSGTSMATPHVAGLAALLVARYPAYTPGQVASAILDNAQDLGTLGWDEYYGCGRIDASLALASGALGDQPICLQGIGPWTEAAPQAFEDAPYVAGEVLVELLPGVRASEVLERHGAGAEFLPVRGAWRLHVPAGQERAVLARLRSDSAVSHAGLNYLVFAQ